jgi:hypothetical protein
VWDGTGVSYLFNSLANLDEDFFDSGFFGAFTQIGQLHIDHLAEGAHHCHLQFSGQNACGEFTWL